MWLKKICSIESYARKKNDFKNSKVRKKDIWYDISQEMLAEGHVICDENSCETKFKNLKRSYTACIDHNAKKCTYYEALQNIFHDDADITSPAVYSRRNSKGLLKRNEQQTPEC